MELINELICQDLGRSIIEHFKDIEIDYNTIVQSKALNALQEIKTIIHNEKLDDFMKVDEIVNIFTKYNISIGVCHDF